MKVKELIAELLELDGELELMLQGDDEANFYKRVYGACGGVLVEGEVYDPSWSADDAGMDEDEWKDMKANSKCVVIY